MTYLSHYSSPIGPMTMASDGSALTGLWFDGQKHFGITIREVSVESGLPVFSETGRWLDHYFSGEIPTVTPSLCLTGTTFQKEVWNLLLAIPYGQTTTYGVLAASIAKSRGQTHFSAQAVGSAVSRNPISLIIPCHRVIGADGSLAGYAGGLEKKRWLLALEQPLA